MLEGSKHAHAPEKVVAAKYLTHFENLHYPKRSAWHKSGPLDDLTYNNTG